MSATLGYGLPDYADPAQAAAAAANDQRLMTDPAFVAAEIERAQAVIIAREAAGMDTLAQRNYLDRLEDLTAGGDWQASGQTPEAQAVAAAAAPASTQDAAPARAHRPAGGHIAIVTQAAAPAAVVTPAATPAQEVASVSVDSETYGYGLPDYTDPAQAAAAAANDQRLMTDPAFVASEIQRTQAVIIAREAAGMETAAQRNYLDRLEDLTAGGDWQASGQTPEAHAVARRYGPQAQDQYAIVRPPVTTAGLFGLPLWAWIGGSALLLIFAKKEERKNDD